MRYRTVPWYQRSASVYYNSRMDVHLSRLSRQRPFPDLLKGKRRPGVHYGGALRWEDDTLTTSHPWEESMIRVQ